MKKLEKMSVLCVFLVAVAVMFMCQGVHALDIPVTSDLNAFYSLDTDDSDITGNGNNISGDAVFTSGEYARFTGTNILEAGQSSYNQFSNQFTISLWMRGFSDYDSIPWRLASKWGSGTRSYYFYYMNDNFGILLSSNGSTSSGFYHGASAYKSVSDLQGVWHHVVLTFDGTAPAGQDNLFVYVTAEGQADIATSLIAEEAAIDSVYQSPKLFRIEGFRSEIDGYATYNRALGISEIEQLYDIGRSIDAVPIPEPATLVILGLGCLLLIRRKA